MQQHFSSNLLLVITRNITGTMLRNSITMHMHITNRGKVGLRSATRVAKELVNSIVLKTYEYSRRLINVTVDNH